MRRKTAGFRKKYELAKAAVAIQPIHSNTTDLAGLGHFVNTDAVGTHLVPFAQDQAMGFEEFSNLLRVPIGHFLKHGHEHAECVVAEQGAAGDGRQVLVFRDGDGEAVKAVEVQHDVEIGAAIPDVDDAIVRHLHGGAEFFEHSNFAVAGRNADDRLDFTACRVVGEPRAVDVIFGHDALEGGLNHFFRSGRDDVELEMAPVEVMEQLRKHPDVLFQMHAFTDLDEMFLAHTTKFGVVQKQVSQLGALLDEMRTGKARDFLFKPR